MAKRDKTDEAKITATLITPDGTETDITHLLTGRDPLEVDARGFATAWLNAFIATGQDDDRGALYRTMHVTLGERGLELAATDSVLLAWSTVDVAGVSFRLGDRSVLGYKSRRYDLVAMDRDHRGRDLLKFVHKDAADRLNAKVRVSLVRMDENPDEPSLGPDFLRDALVIEYMGERVPLPLWDGPAFGWRRLWTERQKIDNEAVDEVRLSVEVLGRYKALKHAETEGGATPAVRFEFAGDRVIAWHHVNRIATHGLVMPYRVHDDDVAPPS